MRPLLRNVCGVALHRQRNGVWSEAYADVDGADWCVRAPRSPSAHGANPRQLVAGVFEDVELIELRTVRAQSLGISTRQRHRWIVGREERPTRLLIQFPFEGVVFADAPSPLRSRTRIHRAEQALQMRESAQWVIGAR
jgi:hypothetical protein